MKRISKRIIAWFFALALILASVNPVALKARAAEGVTLKLHYHRADGNYAKWDVWLWEEGKDGAAFAFTEENGEMVATKEITSGAASVGFIVRTEAWEKDIAEDQFIDIAELVSGTVHIYVESGVKGYKKEYGEDAVKGIKLKSAKYNGKTGIDVVMTAPVEGNPEEVFKITGNGGEPEIESVSEMGSQYRITLKQPLKATASYDIFYGESSLKISMPNVYSTPEFEEEYTYTGKDLGATWTKDKTTFRVWSPVADEMNVKFFKSGNATSADFIEKIPMQRDAKGTWIAEKTGDLNGVYYVYEVIMNGTATEVVDPYAKTTGVNGARSMVIDMSATNPEGWDKDTNPNAGKTYNEAIIYEAHIRDLTMSDSSNIKNYGKFLGLTELGTKTETGAATGLSHIMELGITHLHILPFYDFGSVNEAVGGYNWGYDPVNYNVPEGSYSTDPTKGEVRVSELKQMVKTLHDNGISLVMDVVYNHVYNAAEFSVNKLVPGYFSRTLENGSYSNGSGCGNDTASERSMVRKYIVDSVNYWADEYHIDGFRFDLVGLLDVDTINEIVETVHKNHPDVIFYGEGWSMTTMTTKENVALATQTNSTKTPDFAYFNDKVRDSIKGSVFDSSEKGFVSGGKGREFSIAYGFLGKASWCKTPAQTVNYAACHDNNTLYDRLKLSCKTATEEQIVAMNKLSAAIVLASEGIPFIMSGEEMLRSKVNPDGSFNENSYNAGDTVNAINYDLLSDPVYANVFEYYKGLIAFRKAHPVLTLSTAADVEKYVSRVEENIPEGAVVMQTVGGPEGEKAEKMYVIYNAAAEAQAFTLPEGKWNVYVDDTTAGTKALRTVSGEISVAPISAMILVQETGVSVSDSKGLSTPATIAIVGGSAALVIALAALALTLRKRQK